MIFPGHCVKSVRIRRFSGPYFPAFGHNTERYCASIRVRLRTKWLGVRISLMSLKLQIWSLLRARSSVTFRQIIECGFTFKLVLDTVITYSHDIPSLKIFFILLSLHKKWSFSLRISSVNVIKFLRICSHLIKKSLMVTFIICTVYYIYHCIKYLRMRVFTDPYSRIFYAVYITHSRMVFLKGFR